MSKKTAQDFLNEYSKAYTPRQASEIAGVSYRKILQDIERGILPAYKPGKGYQILPIDLAAYIKKTRKTIDLSPKPRRGRPRKVSWSF